MSKRILAAFLAVMMVVGLLPTTVFAVEDECAVKAQYKDHSKEHCELAGVAYTEVEGSTVAPECGQNGFTMFKCACGEYFADDIIPMDPHVTASGEPTIERQEPTCMAAGKVAIYTCDNCGKNYMDPQDLEAENVDENGNIAKLPHTFDDVSYPDNDCTASKKVCQNEGCTAEDKTHKPAAEHVYNYAEGVITVAPTEETEGVAVFYCTNDGCAQYKEVAVEVLAHVHNMKFTAAVERGEGCEDTGMKAFYTCTVCGNKYYDEAGLAKVEKDEDLIIPAVGHTWTEEPFVIPATCTTWGFEYYGCTKCNIKGETKDLDPLGHTTFEQAMAHDADEDKVAADGLWVTITEGTCSVGTKYEWACERCAKPFSKQDKAVGHENKELKVPATCKNGEEYTIVYCERDICDAAAVAEFKKGEKTYDVTVAVVDGDVYDLPAGETLKVVDIKNIKEVEEPTAHFYLTEVINEPTCTDEGKNFYYCEICNDHFEKDTDALGHLYLDTDAGKANDTAATCTKDATQGCDRAGCDNVKVLTGTKGHKWSKEFVTVAPKCDGTKGYDEYPCTACDATDKRNYTNFVANKSYETLEEAQAEHPALSADKEIFREGNCVLNGYWMYACATCEKNVLVKIDGTGEGHKRPAAVEGVNYYSEATCTQWKGWEETNCTVCGEKIAKEVEMKELGHAMSMTAAKAPTCVAEGNEKYYTCSRECCKDIVYKDAAGNETWENDAHILAKTGHSMSVTVVAKTCTAPAYVHHICLNDGCDVEFVDGYEKEIGHKKGAKEYKEPNCVEAGYENYICANGCGEYFSEKVLPATGHKNKAGETIVDICTDKVTDRNCVNANCPIEKDKNGCRPVAKSHNIVEDVVEAHCKHYGYTMVTCANGCGEMDSVVGVQNPLGHLAPWDIRYTEDMTSELEDVVAWYGEYLNNDDDDETYYVEPTYETTGKIAFKCCAVSCNDATANCGDLVELDVVRTGVDITLEIDNAAVSGEFDAENNRFIDSDVIAVDVYVNAYDVDFWGFNFDVHYNTDSMNYLGYVFNAGDTFGKYMVNAHEDMVSVSAYTEQEMNGEKVDVNVTGTVAVATLYFQIEGIYEYEDEFYYSDYGYAYIGDAWMSNSEGAEDYCFGTGLGFDFADMMDTNDNDIYNIKDLQNCYDIIKGVADYEYLAAADANKDGVVDLVDLELMNKYLVGAATALDVYAALNWNAPEGFVAA